MFFQNLKTIGWIICIYLIKGCVYQLFFVIYNVNQLNTDIIVYTQCLRKARKNI